MGSRLIVCVSVVILAAICAWDLRDTPAASAPANTTTEEVVAHREASWHKQSATTKPVQFRASP